jgi:transmembrane sensor
MTEPDWKAIDRYLAGDASPDEERAVHDWIAADPSRDQVLQHIRAAHGDRPDEQWDVDAAWAKFSGRPQRTVTRHLPVSRWRMGAPARIAAAILVTVGGYAAFRSLSPARPGPQDQTSAEITAPNGQRVTTTLGDGSRVVLNAGSRLRYSPDIGRGSRDVYLEGEAYFDVTHDAKRPFRVHANGGVAHDLGTRFTVRAYPEMTHIDVAVTQGKVSLRRDLETPTDSVVLEPGQLGRLTAFDQQPAVVPGVDVGAYTGWTGGTLVLENVTLVEATPQLERWFDIDIAVPDSTLASRRIFVRFRDESAAQALDALSLALGARYERTGRVVTLHPAAPASLR